MSDEIEPITEWEMIARICGAAALSSLIGFEREFKNKPANVRMHILVGAGSATFVGVALINTSVWQLGDVNRVPAGVASGVGFLGAGTIFKVNDQVSGLTTAAGIWIVAAIGYAVGAGYWFIGIFVTLLVLFVQFGFLFFLSPHFWKDLRDKFRVTYEMELLGEDAEEEESEERRGMLSSSRATINPSGPDQVEASGEEKASRHSTSSANPPDHQSESGKAAIRSHRD